MSAQSEVRDGMQIDWDLPIEMDDGVVLRADLYRPPGGGQFPVILSYGPYAKGLSFQEGYKSQWSRVIKSAPEVLQGSSNKYQNWELVDPEKWVPDGYACLRIDSRGAGRSSGYYRELCRHGGILSDFLASWHPRQVASVQHGVGERGAKSAVTGEPVAGPQTLPEQQLAQNRADTPGEAKRRRLIDDYYAKRTAAFEDIAAPLLSAGNWGGMGLHTRGNFEGFM